VVSVSLKAILDTIEQQTSNDQVTDQVKLLLDVLEGGEKLSLTDLMLRLELKHRPTFGKNYLLPAMEASLIAMPPRTARTARSRAIFDASLFRSFHSKG